MLRISRSAALNTLYRRLADFFVLFLEDFFTEDFFVLLLRDAAFFLVAICITPFHFRLRQNCDINIIGTFIHLSLQNLIFF
jgi:hypothetical protein